VTHNVTPVGFAGLEALASNVAPDLDEAFTEPSAAEAESAVSMQVAPPVDTAAPNTGRVARKIPAGVWMVGGVIALVWVCNNLDGRSSAPTRTSVAVTRSPRPQVTSEVTSSTSTGATPARESNSYVDNDGVVHFTRNPSDPRSGATPRASRLGSEPLSVAAAEPFREHIRAAAVKYALPEALLLAVIAVESEFDPRALSDKGEIGLMQLTPARAKEMFVKDAWDPAQNIEGGARYLRILANGFDGDLVKTLAAYDAGREAVGKVGGEVPDVPERREYARKVVALYQALKGDQRPSRAVATAARTETTGTASSDSSAERKQTKPPIGSGRTMSTDEIRYCVFESARIDFMKPLATDNARIETFNRYVEDYNSRCSSFRYRSGTLEAIRREAAERASVLEIDARRRFY
jgi:hypothetical protein